MDENTKDINQSISKINFDSCKKMKVVKQNTSVRQISEDIERKSAFLTPRWCTGCLKANCFFVLLPIFKPYMNDICELWTFMNSMEVRQSIQGLRTVLKSFLNLEFEFF